MKLLRTLALVALLATTDGFAYTLSPPQVHTTGSWADAVAVGDIDGDGRDDVAVTTTSYFDEANDYKVFVYFQRADGTLAPPRKITYTGFSNETGLAMADLDNDGREEIVVGHNGGIVLMDWSPARKSFQMRSSWDPDPHAGSDAGDLGVLDVNRDGKLDVLGQSWQYGAVVHFGDGHGGISRTLKMPTPLRGYNDLEIGDFNGDGHDDFAEVAMQGANAVFVYYNDGTDDFAEPIEIAFEPGFDQAALGAGDFNSDGREDLAIAFDRTHLVVYYQDSNGVLQAPRWMSTDWDPQAIIAHDLDIDGRDDVVVLHGGGGVGYYLQGAVGFGEEVLAGGPYATHLNTLGLAAGDLNGDACPDVAVANYNYGLVVFPGAGCPGITDLAVSLGLTTSVVSLRLDNFGSVDAESPEIIATVSMQRGTLLVGALPAGCTLQSTTARSARVRCEGSTLAAGTSRTLLIPISISGGDHRSALTVSATATTSTVDRNLANNRFSKTVRAVAVSPAVALRSRATTTPVKAKTSR